MVESPLLIKPYLRDMSRSALFALMTTGMATIAGTVMVLYATLIGDAVPNAMGHILTASLISAPAALVIAGLMIPAAATRDEDAIPRIAAGRQRHGRGHPRHAGCDPAAAQHHGHADRDGRAGQPRQRLLGLLPAIDGNR
jgi:hypothetical protein